MKSSVVENTEQLRDETLKFRLPGALKRKLAEDAVLNTRDIQDSALHYLKRGLEIAEREQAELEAIRAGKTQIGQIGTDSN